MKRKYKDFYSYELKKRKNFKQLHDSLDRYYIIILIYSMVIDMTNLIQTLVLDEFP